jgi:hypothetical protein
MDEKLALQEANRLNRLYSAEYKAYLRALEGKQTRLEKRKADKLAREVAHKDKTNAVFDELYAMTHYTYVVEGKKVVKEVNVLKPRVKKILKVIQLYNLPKEPRPVLTQAMVQAKFFYDSTTGEITHNEGRYADKSAVQMPSPPKMPYKQNLELNRLPLRAKGKLPVHTGFASYTTDAYALLDDEVRLQCIRRYYLERNPDLTATNATVRKTYYIRAIPRTPRVYINKNSYLPQAIAYLYMGAGGRFDYTGGLDNIQRIAQEVTCEPYGTRHINPKTNKPCAYPCRDGNPLNYAWDNIKPEPLNTAVLTRAPDAPRKPINRGDAHLPDTYKRRMTYSTERNVRVEDGTYTVHSMGTGNKVTVCDTWEDAVTVFNAQLKRIKGVKTKLANGNIMVTTEIKKR